MNRRRTGLIAAAGVLAAALAGAAWVNHSDPDTPNQATGSATTLGPRDGDRIDDYVASTHRALLDRAARDDEATYALVSLSDYVTPDALPAALPVEWVRALVRVPIDRVQTAILQIPARTPADVTGGMLDAANRLGDDAERTGDPVSRAVDSAQADRLRARCACVLAVVAHATPDALLELADEPLVRAVEAAPAGEPLVRLAFAPPLPEQTGRVSPPPDDGAADLVDPATF